MAAWGGGRGAVGNHGERPWPAGGGWQGREDKGRRRWKARRGGPCGVHRQRRRTCAAPWHRHRTLARCRPRGWLAHTRGGAPHRGPGRCTRPASLPRSDVAERGRVAGGGGWGESARRGRIEERSRRTVVVDGDAGGEEHAALDRLGVVASQLDLSRGVGGHEGEGAPLEHVVACVVFDPGVGDGEEQRKREGRRRGPAAAAAAWHHGGDAAGRGRGGLVLDGHAEAHDAIDAVEVRAVTVCDGSELGVDIVVADLYHVSALVAFQVGIISVSEQEHLFGYNTECFTFQWIENGAISRVKRYFKAFSLCCCWAAIRQHLFSCLII